MFSYSIVVCLIVQVVLHSQIFDFRITCAFVYYKFSPLICLLYAAQLTNQHFEPSYSGAVLSVQPKLYGLGNVIICFELHCDAAGDIYFAC